MWDTRAIVTVHSSAAKGGSTSGGRGGRGGDGKNGRRGGATGSSIKRDSSSGGGGGNGGGKGPGSSGDSGGKGGGKGAGNSSGARGDRGEENTENDNDVVITGEVLDGEIRGTKVKVETYDRKFFLTERAFVPYERIVIFDHRIRQINAKNIEECLEAFPRAGNERRVGSMTVTIDSDDIPAGGTLDDVMTVVNGRNVIADGVRVCRGRSSSSRCVRAAPSRNVTRVQLDARRH